MKNNIEYIRGTFILIMGMLTGVSIVLGMVWLMAIFLFITCVGMIYLLKY
jgi:hypothetical protein